MSFMLSSSIIVFCFVCGGITVGKSLPSPRATSCPAVTLANHSTWTPDYVQGDDLFLWQEFCTNNTSVPFHGCCWSRIPFDFKEWCTECNDTYPVDPGTVCINMTLSIANVSFPNDTGIYTATVTNNCGTRNSSDFTVSVDNCTCGPDDAPTPAIAGGKTRVSGTPHQNLTLKVDFFGCSSDNYFGVEVTHNDESVCTVPSTSSSDDVISSEDVICTRDHPTPCWFTLTVTIVSYSSRNAGTYCFQAFPLNQGGSHGNKTCLDIVIEGAPIGKIVGEAVGGAFGGLLLLLIVCHLIGCLIVGCVALYRVGQKKCMLLHGNPTGNGESPHPDSVTIQDQSDDPNQPLLKPVVGDDVTEADSTGRTSDYGSRNNSPVLSSERVQQLVSLYKEEIMTSVKPTALLAHLQRNKLVSQGEAERINSSSTNHQRTELIIQALPSKGEDAIERFTAALSEEKQHPPHQRLAKTLTLALKGSPPTSPTAGPSVKDIIYLHMPTIVQLANPLALLVYLMSHGLVIKDDVDYIRNTTRIDSERIHYIISELFRCGERAVETFIRCLIEEKTHPPHRELAELLIRELSQQEQHRGLADTLRGDLEEARRRGLREDEGQGSSERRENTGQRSALSDERASPSEDECPKLITFGIPSGGDDEVENDGDAD